MEVVLRPAWVEVNAQYYRDILQSQHMLDAIKNVTDDNFVLQQQTVHRCIVHTTVQLLLREILNFISPELWLPTAQS